MILPIFVRRRAPLAAVAAYAAGVVVSAVPTFDQFRCGVAVPVALVLLFSLAARRPLRPALTGFAVVLAALVFLCYTDQILKGDLAGFALFAFPLCGVVWWAGRVARSRDTVAAELEARSRLLRRRREETARLAVEVERTRLASDLDVAARDRVREVIALAQLGEALPAGHPETQALFARIERQARASLAQLETLLAEARAGGRWTSRSRESGVRCPAVWSWRPTGRSSTPSGRSAGGTASRPASSCATCPRRSSFRCRAPPRPGGGADAALAAARERVTAHGGRLDVKAPQPGRRVLEVRLPVVSVP